MDFLEGLHPDRCGRNIEEVVKLLGLRWSIWVTDGLIVTHLLTKL